MPHDHYDKHTKLYIQLKPDTEAIRRLDALRQKLDTASFVSDDQLHLTVIHFGEIERFRRSLSSEFSVSDELLFTAISKLVQRWSAIIEHTSLTLNLRTSQLSFFGARNRTLVTEFERSTDTTQLHQQCLRELILFLSEIGLPHPEMFLQQDSNLKHSLFFKPHVTISKRYSGETLLEFPPFTASFHPMKIVY